MADFVSKVPAQTPNVQAVAAVSARPGSAASAPFNTDWQRFVNTDIIAALSGTATSVTAIVQRSSVDPAAPLPGNGAAQGAAASPADATGFSGNLATGVAPNIYTESGVGWWRISVTAISGGNCIASLSGKSAP